MSRSTAPSEEDRLTLLDILDVVRRRKVSVVLVTLGTVLSALFVSFLQTPVYKAESEVLLQRDDAGSGSSWEGGSAGGQVGTVETEARVLKSDPVRAAVRKALGTAPNVSASRVGETEVMQVEAVSTDPRLAAKTANAYVKAYVEFRKQAAAEQLLTVGNELEARIQELQAKIDDVGVQLGRPAGARTAMDEELRSRYTSLLTQQAELSKRLDQLRVNAALAASGARVVRQADVPASPAKPKPLVNGMVALAVGLVAGGGLAVLREHLDDSVNDKDELRRAARDLPVLAVIPTVIEWKRASGPPLPLNSSRASSTPATEAYRNLRTSIGLLDMDRRIRSLQITSPLAGEGKTTTLANLGLVFATTGQRVVLLDMDLRRPRLHRAFDLVTSTGFTSVLAGETTLGDAVQRVPHHESLFLLPSGPAPPDPSELLSSKRVADLMFALRTSFDLLLVDSAPVLPVTDAAVVSRWVEATVLVARAGATTRRQVAEAVELLEQADASLAGIVLNGAKAEVTYGYAYEPDGDVTAKASGDDRKATPEEAEPDGDVTAEASGDDRKATPEEAEPDGDVTAEASGDDRKATPEEAADGGEGRRVVYPSSASPFNGLL